MGICGSKTKKTGKKSKVSQNGSAVEESYNKGMYQSNNESNSQTTNQKQVVKIEKKYRDASAPNQRRNSTILAQRPQDVNEDWLQENYTHFQVIAYSKGLVLTK